MLCYFYFFVIFKYVMIIYVVVAALRLLTLFLGFLITCALRSVWYSLCDGVWVAVWEGFLVVLVCMLLVV